MQSRTSLPSPVLTGGGFFFVIALTAKAWPRRAPQAPPRLLPAWLDD